LVLESLEGVKLAEQALHLAPDGDWQGRLPDELRASQGTGVVEGPRGMLRYTLESDGQRLKKVRIDAPRQLDRLLTRTLLANGLIDNAVAIIASCDTCTACAER
jgi:Ni,Fe-hydrogenase III large subunit